MYNLVRNLSLACSVFICAISLFFKEPKMLLIAILILFFHNILFSLKDFYKNSIFFCFNLTFFIFLIGRMVVNEFFGYNSSLGIFGLAFEEENIIMTILFCIYLALLAMYIGYILIQKVNLNFLKYKNKINPSFMHSLRTFSLFFFYLCVIFRYLNIYEMNQVSAIEGYYESYSTFTSSLPTLLILLSEMFDIAFFAYLSTNPSKKRSFFPIMLYIFEGLFATLSGRRSLFMLNLLIIFIYYCIRNVKSTEQSEKKWLGKFEWSIVSLLTPILIILMSFIEKRRSSYSNTSTFNILDSISNFLHSQGISANVIGYSKLYEEYIPSNKFYTFGPILEFIDNKIVRPIKGLPELWGQSQERALDGYLFTHMISFIIMPTLYLKGVGYGSSFVAELYNDFSFIGVFVGSMIYGSLLFIFCFVLLNSNFILVIFVFMMTRAILFAPRAATLSFIVSAFTISKIIGLAIILIGSKILQTILVHKDSLKNN